jgi:Flp pilus assembly pilin Flp
MKSHLFRLVRALVADDRGQDLVEYALLGTFVGLIGVAAFTSLESAIQNTYAAWNTNNNSNWQMPAPGGS